MDQQHGLHHGTDAAAQSSIAGNRRGCYEGRPSAVHSTYIKAAFEKGGATKDRPFVGHDISEYAPRPGDLIAQCREEFATGCDPLNQGKAGFRSITAFVVASTDCYVTTIGGAENASVQMRHLPIDAKGFLKPSGTGN
jgi:hypothetical protein